MTPREAQQATAGGSSMIVETRSGAHYEVEALVVDYWTDHGEDYVYGFRVNAPRNIGPSNKKQQNGTVRWFRLKNVKHVTGE